MSQAQESIKKPDVKNSYELATLTNLLKETLDESTKQNLNARRKEIADFYYSKQTSVTYKDKLDFYEELKMLHVFFNYKEVQKPFGGGKGFAKKTRTVDEKKKDIDTMHEFCWNKAIELAEKLFPVDIKSSEGFPEVDINRKDRMMKAAGFYTAFVHNWSLS